MNNKNGENDETVDGYNENYKFIHPKINLEDKNLQLFYKENIFKIFLLILILYKHYYVFERFIQGALYENKSFLITSKPIFWKDNKHIDINKMDKEIKNYEKFDLDFKNSEIIFKSEKPKVSLIIPVYNQEQFIKRIYSNILNQTLKDIEIVFIDDFSIDNSSKIISELMEIDKRITYIKNEKNRGAFYSRNIGVLNSLGEYVLCVDIDDFLLNDILIKSYETAKEYNLDIVQFYVMAGDIKENIFWRVLKYKSGIIRNEKVKDVFFRGTTRNTWDKFVKREVFIKSINFLDINFRNRNYVVYNDDVTIFALFKSAESYGFLEEIGYFYNWGVPNSTTHIYLDKNYVNDIFKCGFTIMECYFKQTNNNYIEKNAGYVFFIGKFLREHKNKLNHLTKRFDYIIKILDLYINNKYCKLRKKRILRNFRKDVINIKLKKNNK